MDIGQYCHAGLVQQAHTKFLRILGTNQRTSFGDIRPHVEGTARVQTGHSRHLVEQVDNQITALLKTVVHQPGAIL